MSDYPIIRQSGALLPANKFLSLVLSALCCAGCSGEPEQPRPPAAAELTEAAAPAPAEPEFVFPAERLFGIQAELNALGAPYGAAVPMEQLQAAAKHRLNSFKRGFRASDARDLALPAPAILEFTQEEKDKPGPRAKWLAGGAWSYGDALPRDGAAVSEAWGRLYGSRDLSAGHTIFIQTNVPKDIWQRFKWQPGKSRWSYYTEEEELAGMRNLLNARYSVVNQDSRNSARFACERMQRAVSAATAAGRDPSGFYGTMRGALLQAFDKDLEREALRYYIDAGGK